MRRCIRSTAVSAVAPGSQPRRLCYEDPNSSGNLETKDLHRRRKILGSTRGRRNAWEGGNKSSPTGHESSAAISAKRGLRSK